MNNRLIEQTNWNLIRKIDKWSQDELQFPRLLDEIQANINFTEEQKESLCISMNLEWEDILEIFGRATERFDEIKENI